MTNATATVDYDGTLMRSARLSRPISLSTTTEEDDVLLGTEKRAHRSALCWS